MREPRRNVEIAVVGAGAAGLAGAIALAREGFAVTLVGRPEPRADGRTVALLDGSVRFLAAIGAWQGLATDSAPLTVMRIVDDTGSLFRPPPATFSAREIGLEAFGYNIENTKLIEQLGRLAAAEPNLTIEAARAQSLATDPVRAILELEDGRRLAAELVIAADGRRSRLREAAGIRTREWSYPQVAITAILAHARDHGEASTEFHTRTGPFTLVPLPGRRSSLVWVCERVQGERIHALDDDGFARAVERRAASMLGRMSVAGPRGLIPLSGLTAVSPVGPRLILAGEAAHVLPPIGAQGLNLGLRDVAAARDVLVDARAEGQDLGAEDVLARYGRARRLDVAVRTRAIDALNRSLLTAFLPLDLMRGAGLLALELIPPLRRAVMREGLAPQLGMPRLMRDRDGAVP